MIKKIVVPETLIEHKRGLKQKVYLDDLVTFGHMKFEDLHNTVFNKGATGIGGTSLALDSDDHIIILMPFKEVVNNKEGYNSETFTVKEGVTIPKIVRYLKTTVKRKIVSTYDGFSKIIDAYERADIDIRKDFLLIDEWQVIFKHYTFRNSVMKFLLSKVQQFEKVCFMTATPIKKEWWFDEMKHLDELNLEYDLPEVTVKHRQVYNIVDEAVAICKMHLDDKRNAHLFCNSVDFIKKVLQLGNLKQDDVRIICSESNEGNKVKLTGFKIESTKCPVKKINFYTSTCFEGCDLFDKEGKIYVLCDGKKVHTLIDISTTLPQIAGRIRDILESSIDLIYTSSTYINITREEFEKSTALCKEKAHQILN